MAVAVILFNNVNFCGDYHDPAKKDEYRHITDSTADLGSFDNLTSSIIVCEGEWELWSERNFGGLSWSVSSKGGPKKDGLYPSFKDWGGLNDDISSVRPKKA
jgi:hypothetical protein